MEVASQTRYGRCPSCSAINMAHRKSCYRCRKPLPSAEEERPTKGGLPLSAVEPKINNGRREQRAPLLIRDVLIEGEVPLDHRVSVLDISMLGLKIRSATPMKIGAKIKLHLPADGRMHPVDGEIRYRVSAPTAEVPLYVYGVKLDRPYPAVRRLIGKP